MEHKKLTVKHFIGEPVAVHFSSPPTHTKKPPCPDRFTWREENYQITFCRSAWKDFSRHGRMAQNMQPQHAQVASQRGSWGVGRFYFEVQTRAGRAFRLYYDRAPKNALDRKGQWILLAELTNE
jgi:hypothetical protein